MLQCTNDVGLVGKPQFAPLPLPTPPPVVFFYAGDLAGGFCSVDTGSFFVGDYYDADKE